MSNAFTKFHALGYTRLVPIIPPKADISERSSLHKRVGTRQDARGKSPGIRGRDGKWFGFDWVPYEADDHDLDRWGDMGAGVGMKTGQGLVVIDADTTNENFARVIRDVVEEVMGRLPIRVGRYPKAAYVLRVSEDIPYQRVEFGPRDERGNAERVEILTDRKQFVVHGVHPVTGKPYEWTRDLPPFADLPVFTPAQITTLMEKLRSALPDAGKVITEGSHAEIDQHTLTGTLEHVRKAVAALPNTSDLFPSREHYRDIGYAIKAALPDHEDEAFEIFADWCARWQEGDNDPDVVAADWSRMKPPYRRGASWLYELAEQHGTSFSRADIWFEDEQARQEENPFAQIEQEAETKRSELFRVLDIGDILNRPAPRWLIKRYIPKIGLGFLYSEPGAGKSFLALDMALTIASGGDNWHGDRIDVEDDAIVLYIAAEGSYGFRNRIRGWLKHKRIDPAKLPNRFKMIEQTVNFMDPDDVKRLLETVRRSVGLRPCLIVVDTVSRAMPGADENLQKEMTLFVRACDMLRDAFTCTVFGVHHAGKSGDMRGSTVLLGAGDFVFRLTRKKGATVGSVACEKMKDGPDGWDEPYSFDQISLKDFGNSGAQAGEDGEDAIDEGGEHGQTSVVVTRCDMGIGPSAELTPGLASSILKAMQAAWEAGEPWSMAPQAALERRARYRLYSDFGVEAVQADAMLDVWLKSGMVEVAMLDSRNRRKGLKVRADPGQFVSIDGIFD